MRLVVKVQQHLVLAYRENDSGDFVFVLCRRGLEQAIGRKLKPGERFTIEVSITEVPNAK